MVAEAAEALGSAPGLGPVGGDDARAGARRTYYRARDVRLRGLLASLRGDERVRQFAAAELEPVLGPERTADLELLERLLASGGIHAIYVAMSCPWDPNTVQKEQNPAFR